MALKLIAQTKSIQSLYGSYRSGALLIDRAYQRKLVWTLNEKQKLINSILNDFPVPLILLVETSENPEAQFILDGMQRLNAIFGFIENQFSLEDGKYFDVEEFATAKDALETNQFDIPEDMEEKLTRALCSKILDYSVPISVIQNAEEEEVIEVFGRINSYGRQLSEQEQRQAGLRSLFSETVREIACEIRGDASPRQLPLFKMPSISIDPPSALLGYGIDARTAFWVQQKILRSTDLRDSMDEQVIADTLACSLLEAPIGRSKKDLNSVYDIGSENSELIDSAIQKKTLQNAKDEYKYVIAEIIKIVDASKYGTLLEIVFKREHNNAFQSIFAAIYLGLYELAIKQEKAISDYVGVANGLENVADRLTSAQKGSKAGERQKNIETVIGLIDKSFANKLIKDAVYASPTALDVSNVLMASLAENTVLELKQGLLRLDGKSSVDEEFVKKIPNIICGIANITEYSEGFIVIGIADKESDAKRIADLYGVEKSDHNKFMVTGIAHEYKALGTDLESHINRVRDKISASGLSAGAISSVLQSLCTLTYMGKELICMKVKRSVEVEFNGEKCYIRNSDETIEATPKQISDLTTRKAKLQL
jgi:hypothetical protein